MQQLSSGLILAALSSSWLCGQAVVPRSADTESIREAWMRHVEPTPVELRWDEIPWQPTFGDGLLVANQKRRPLLLYAMNGHPLGNT